MNKPRGFTIVELLIVIVVIGILAAITVVAFNGIQNRGYDATVQSNLKNIGSKVMQYQALYDAYPANTQSGMEDIIAVTKSAYPSTGNNFGYCQIREGAGMKFSITGRSKSGKGFYFSSTDGLKEMSTWSETNAILCPLTGVPSDDPLVYRFLWVYAGSWLPWVKG